MSDTMIARYKNKHMFKAVLPGILLAGLLWGTKDVSAKTELAVGGSIVGSVYFYDTASELAKYRTDQLYFYCNCANVIGVLEGADSHDPGGPRYEIHPPIEPKVYNFQLKYTGDGPPTVSCTISVGFVVYDTSISSENIKVSYGQTVNGTITVSDIGQTRKLVFGAATPKLAGDGQKQIIKEKLPLPLKVRVTGTGDIVKKGIPITFTATPATADYSFSGTESKKTYSVRSQLGT